MKKNIIFKGYLTGLILQLAIGPVFLVILNIALEYGFLYGMFAVAGVVIVDYFYIILAIFGVGKLLEASRYRKVFSNISSVVLIFFGFVLIRKGILLNLDENIEIKQLTILKSFGSTFLLTLSSPLTIVFWTSIFTNKSMEYDLTKVELIIFGIAAGFATLSFLSILVMILSLLDKMIPAIVIKILNIVVGIILVSFGTKRIIKDNKNGT